MITAWLRFRRHPDRQRDTENRNTMWIYKENMQKERNYLKKRKCFDVDKHSGRCAREDRWDILFRLTRRWKKLPFLKAACTYFSPLRAETPTSDQLTAALSPYSDHQPNLPLCWKHHSTTRASQSCWLSMIGRQLLQVSKRKSLKFEKSAYSLSCQERDENMDNNQTSLRLALSFR